MMAEPTIEELRDLLSKVYNRLPNRLCGRTALVEFDSAGSDYEFTEYEWSERCREILGITAEPSGI